MLRFLLLGVLLTAVSCATTPPSSHEEESASREATQEIRPRQCVSREILMEILGSSHGESLAASGITDNGDLFELFASETTWTWSMVITKREEHYSCLIASGESFRFVDQDQPLEQISAWCGEHTVLRESLERNRYQHITGYGVTTNNGRVEILSAGNATWSLIASVPWGDTCVIATGTNWHIHKSTGHNSTI